MQLVIAEKPSVAKSLADVLGAKQKKNGYFEGNGYIVSWCVGHLVGLVEADRYDERYANWKRSDLPIIPAIWKYSVYQNKKGQFNILKGLMNRKDIESLICATDAGREGELIFRFVYDMANCKKPFKRLWISSMEVSAIKKGFEDLKDSTEYDALYNSALCRAKSDWIVGINATRLYSSIHGKKLSVGRVQSPTLNMLVERQEKISGFTKERYHIVRLDLGNIEAISERVIEPDKAMNIQATCNGKQAVCVSIMTEKKNTAPPKLFDLTTLQRESNRLFGLTAKETLDSAQKLYETKLITYPRTDSRFLTSDMAKSLSKIATSSASYINMPDNKSANIQQVINDKKVSDHHAIIPTGEISNTPPSALDVTERKVLYLIITRFLSALGDRHEYDSIVAVFDCNGHSFTTNGKIITANGWKGIDEHFREVLKLNKSNTDEEEEENALPQISEGQIFEKTTTTITEHFTQPPKPYTESTLLQAMEQAGVKETDKDAERKGLGTPATRASIIEKLVDCGFAYRKNRQLLPTDEGIFLISILPDILKSPSLTADWENDLARISKGELSPDLFMGKIEDMIKELINTTK